MTPKEILDRLDKTFIGDLELKVALTRAVEKQIPKKPVNKTLEYDGYYGYCPCCNHVLSDYREYKRCYSCGQALDWSDTE